MSDRIVVMNDGGFEQVGGPDEVYDHPASVFVADFIGKANIFRGSVSAVDGQRLTVPVDDGGELLVDHEDGLTAGTEVGVVVRPEDIQVADADEELSAANVAEGEVTLSQRIGDVVEYRIETEQGTELVVIAQASRTESRYRRGDRVRTGFTAEAPRVLTRESVVDSLDVDADELVEPGA